MKDRDLQELFEAARQAPDASARERALAAALEEFDTNFKHSDKGFSRSDRLTTDTDAQQGSNTMNQSVSIENHSTTRDRPTSVQRSWWYRGLASAAVLVLAVTVVLQMPEDRVQEPAFAGRPPVVPAQLSREDKARQPADEVDNDLVAPGLPYQEAYQAAGKAVAGNAAGQNTVAEAVADNRRAEETELSYSAKPEAMKSVTAGQLTQMSRAADMAAAKRMSVTAPLPQPGDLQPASGYRDQGRDDFETVAPNAVKRVAEDPVSTFSIDVDTVSYSFVRRQLNHGILPQKAAVRLEEMVNYFSYDYPQPDGAEQPFATSVTLLDSPWKAGNKLVHIGIKGYELPAADLPRSNLVLLLDVSGSMNSADKLPLVKQSMSLLLERLQPEDTVAIVVYAGAAGTVLEPTEVRNKQKILDSLQRLRAGGSTAGAQGIRLAYELAEANFVKDGINRIILATDGDFNVGITNREELKGFVERKRRSGIYLSVLGFGQGNYQDRMMQTLAQNGNGVAAYIDTLGEAQKVLVDEATSALFTIASDVKIQVEFNPATVSEYRLLGYETRALAREDFNNDAVDAGDIGAGHTVTAIYEITPRGASGRVFEESRYATAPVETEPDVSDEYGFIKLRYKLPGEGDSKLISQKIPLSTDSRELLLQEGRFATAVAGFAQLLQGGKYTGGWDYEDALELALQNRGHDDYGYRSEFVQLIRRAALYDR